MYKSLLTMLFILVSACATADSASQSNSTGRVTDQPYYRFWRGAKLTELNRETYVDVLSRTFIPSATATHAKNGLLSYVVALPGGAGGETLPDELALLAYESKEVYDLAKATPEGQAYTALHWTLFAQEKSKSVVPLSFAATNPAQLAADTAYDMLELPIDWQNGVTAVFVGTRKAEITGAEFLAELTAHVRLVKDKFGPRGLRGYIVLGTEDYEIAYINWSSQQAMDDANGSADGTAVAADAEAFMNAQMWKTATPFAGKVKDGDAVTVPFQVRRIQ